MKKKSEAMVEDRSLAEKLKESEEKFKYIFNNLNDAIVIHDLNGQILEVNDVFLKRLNYSKKEFMSLSPGKVDAPDFAKDVPKRVKDVLRNGFSVFESVHLTKEGKRIPVEVNAKFIEFEGKKAIISICRDISERKKSEESLKVSEEKFKSIFDSSPFGMHMYELKSNGDLVFIDANMSADRILKVRNKDFIGKTIGKAFPDLSKTRIPLAYKKVILSGQDWHDSQVNYSEGKIVGAFDVYSFKIAPNKMVASFQDITEKKKSEEEAKQNAEKYKQLFENANDAIWLMDKNLFVDCNSAVIEMFGCSDKKDMINHTPLDFSPIKQPDGKFSKEKALKYIGAAYNGYPQRFYWKHQKKDGTPIDAEISLNVVILKGKKYLQAIGRDITEKNKAEEALKIKNIIFDKSEASNSISDSRGIITEVNDNFFKILGYSNRKEVIGKHVSQFFYNKKKVGDLFKVLNKNGKWSGEIVAKRKDGFKVIVFGSCTTLNNREGKIIGYQSSMYNITKLKEVEEELRQSKLDVEKQIEERTAELNKQKTFLSSILENVPNMIFVKDAKDLKFELFNKAGEELLGYKRQQLIGKSDYDFFPKNQAEFFIKKDKDVIKSGKLLDIPEEPINTKNGKRFLHTKKIPIYDDHTAKYLMGISEDITERKKTEIEYRALLENMLDGLAIIDVNGNLLEVNDSYCKMLKYSKEDLLKLNLNFIDVNNDLKKTKEYIKEVTVAGSGKFETKHKRKDGVVIDVEMSINYLESSNKLFAFIHDITDRKKYEKELLTRAEDLERFNRVAVGRELKMVELKKKLAKLEGEGK